MIKTNELRVGNVIRYTSDLIPEDTGISKIECISGEEIRTPFTWFLSKEIFAIKLTKEIFYCIKCMFHDNNEEFDDFILEVNSISKLSFEFQPKTNDYTIQRVAWRGNDNAVTKEKNIKYLHELQNIYFALTGEELVIDMNKLNELN